MGLAQLGTIASCQTSPVDEPVDEEGLPTGGAGGSSGGTGGVPGGESCDGTPGMGGECGVCQVSLDDYCAEHDCATAEFLDVCFHSAGRAMFLGCGYKKVTLFDEERSDPPRIVDVWHAASGELLYHYERPQNGDGCATVVGEEPVCDEYGDDDCYIEPCFECLSGCAANMGCIFPGDIYATCEARAAALCGTGGAGGEGGHGGFGGADP
jgi:hypothetical protein